MHWCYYNLKGEGKMAKCRWGCHERNEEAAGTAKRHDFGIRFAKYLCSSYSYWDLDGRQGHGPILAI